MKKKVVSIMMFKVKDWLGGILLGCVSSSTSFEPTSPSRFELNAHSPQSYRFEQGRIGDCF